MDAQPIDPRDIAWEIDAPTYRVIFARREGSAADEWRLTEAVSIHEVLTWADARLDDDSTYEVFVEMQSNDGLGTLRLVGPDSAVINKAPR